MRKELWQFSRYKKVYNYYNYYRMKIDYNGKLEFDTFCDSRQDETARKWYEKEAYEQMWSVRTLQRNIDTQYYYRLL